MKKWLGTFISVGAILGLMGCAAQEEKLGKFDPMAGSEELSLPAKADGLVIDLTLGQTVEGHVGGTALALYSLKLKQGSFIRAEVKRSSGDLQAQAFLHASINALGHHHSFLPPARLHLRQRQPDHRMGDLRGWRVYPGDQGLP